jgi:glycine cleavage system transcriptional repressor
MSNRIKELPGAEARDNRPAQVLDNNYLLVNAIADSDVQLLSVLGKRAVDSGCNLLEARVSILGKEVCALLLAGGAWDAIAKFENALTRLAREESVVMQVKRTGARTLAGNTLPYAIEVIAADRPGILYQLSDFFARRGVVVDSLNSSRYRANQTGAEMFQATLAIGIPSQMHISLLRDEFLEFCDSLNLDAILEPIKG